MTAAAWHVMHVRCVGAFSSRKSGGWAGEAAGGIKRWGNWWEVQMELKL